MTSFKIPKKTIVLINEGVYPATIEAMEKGAGNFGEQIKFTFDLGNQFKLTGWTSTNYSEKSKLFSWTKAVLADTFDPKADFDTDWLLGQQVLIQVSKRMGTDGNTYNKIEAVLGLPKQSTVQKAAPIQPAHVPVESVQPAQISVEPVQPALIEIETHMPWKE
jgi:hypothetical protein